MHEQSAEIDKIAAAMSKLQGELPTVAKTKTNPHWRSKYADLPTCMESLLPLLSKHGLAFVTTFGHDGDLLLIYGTITHSSGQWIRGCLALKPERNGPQAIGSLITYGRRYLAGMFGLVTDEDDDAEHADQQYRDAAKAKPLTPDSPIVRDTKRVLDQCPDYDEVLKVWAKTPPEVQKEIPTEYREALKEKHGA